MRVAKFDFIDCLVSGETSRIDNFNSVAENQQTDSCRLQEINVNQCVLKQFLKDWLRYFQITCAVESLAVLRPSEK